MKISKLQNRVSVSCRGLGLGLGNFEPVCALFSSFFVKIKTHMQTQVEYLVNTSFSGGNFCAIRKSALNYPPQRDKRVLPKKERLGENRHFQKRLICQSFTARFLLIF